MHLIKSANDGAAFVLELAAVAGLAWWGFSVAHGLAVRAVAGVAAPLTFLLVWSQWLAPRAEHRLELP